MMDIVLELPIPPALNKLRRIDWANHSAHKAWQRSCDQFVMAAGGIARFRNDRTFPIITGKFAIDILLDRSCKYDLDAVVKQTVDYFVRIDAVPDDSQKYLDDVHLHWGDAPEGMRVTIRAVTE